MTPTGAAALNARGARRRFLLLRGLRWLPTGLLIPVLVLFLLDRGLTLGEIGLVTAAQGLVLMLLELPTGALADALGRRRVLLGAISAEAAAVALLIMADSLPALVVVFALQGVYRALDSGPLDAWYVDTAQAADPDADIERGLARGGVVLGLATGPIGLLAAYLATMAVHGAANPVHQAMLHRAVVGPSTRATVISANSLTAQTGGALGGIALGALADAAGLTAATLVGAAVLASAAPLYLIVGRRIPSAQPHGHRT